jgi:hypothetical protein
MLLEAERKHSRAEEKVKIAAVDANEQTQRVHEAVARRAFEIFESRGSASWHDLEDWRQAEAELVRPSCFGRMSVDGTLWMGIDATDFEEGTIEIWVAPHQLTICGKRRAEEGAAVAIKRSGPSPEEEMIFHVIDQTCEIDPERVTARINGPSLEILLRKAGAEPVEMREAKAAVA